MYTFRKMAVVIGALAIMAGLSQLPKADAAVAKPAQIASLTYYKWEDAYNHGWMHRAGNWTAVSSETNGTKLSSSFGCVAHGNYAWCEHKDPAGTCLTANTRYNKVIDQTCTDSKAQQWLVYTIQAGGNGAPHQTVWYNYAVNFYCPNTEPTLLTAGPLGSSLSFACGLANGGAKASQTWEYPTTSIAGPIKLTAYTTRSAVASTATCPNGGRHFQVWANGNVDLMDGYTPYMGHFQANSPTNFEEIGSGSFIQLEQCGTDRYLAWSDALGYYDETTNASASATDFTLGTANNGFLLESTFFPHCVLDNSANNMAGGTCQYDNPYEEMYWN